MSAYDHTVEVHDYSDRTEGCKIYIRQNDIGYEYKTPWHEWRKANNKEQAIEFARLDAISQGKAHEWREKGQGNPYSEGEQWAPEIEPRLQPSKTRRSFLGHVRAYLSQIK